MGFKQPDVDKLLADTKRRCCVCLKFCGTYIEIHHINQSADNGSDNIDNAIPLCFECHAEVNHYNVRHPKGRKYTAEELKLHRNNWLDICKNHPEVLVSAPKKHDIGPLESMRFELEFNVEALNIEQTGPAGQRIPGLLKDKAYDRAVNEGLLNLIDDDTRKTIMCGYRAISKINHNIDANAQVRPEGEAYSESVNKVLTTITQEADKVKKAYDSLVTFLDN